MRQVLDRETLEVDVLIVGGGAAGMSAALRLAQLQKEKGGEPLAIAALNESPDAAAAAMFAPVLRELLSGGRTSASLVLPRVPGLGIELDRDYLEANKIELA